MNLSYLILIIMGLLWVTGAGWAATEDPASKKLPPGITEKVGEIAGLNYVFSDVNGDSLNVSSLVDRPTIISFVYFKCPGICSPLLSGLVDAVELVDAKPGVDFQVITISINKDETAELAKRKKRNYLNGFKRDFPEDRWWWLTGDSVNIEGVTRDLGFGFQRKGDDFAHGASIMVLSKDRKISRYLSGVTFNPFDLKMALIEASEGRSNPTITKMVKFCFSYDPEGRKYVFNLTKVAGGAILLFTMIFLLVIVFKRPKTNEKR